MAGSTKYLRYILFAFLCLVLIFFISSSSGIPGQTYQSASDLLEASQSRWKGSQADDVGLGSGSKANDFKQGSPADEVKVMAPDPHAQIPPKANTPAKPVPADSSLMSDKTSPNPQTGTSKTGLASAKASGPRMNATFVTLARNSDVWEISRSIRQVEDRFNHRYNYDWVFLNDQPFDETFKSVTTALTSGKARYGEIPKDHWSYPDFIDQDKAKEVREDMARRKIIYGDSVSYRHMCRYESGFFFRHPIMLEYEWYWRVEPSIELYCDIEYDTFKFMADNNKKYSFVLSLYEYVETIPTLWDSVKKFMAKYPEHLDANNSMEFLSDDGGKTYNHCHFWSNFEIGNLDWLRSDAYVDFFDVLDKDGGFFYERWGDAPVHSIGAGLTLPKDQIHFFNDIAYYHVPFTHCPLEEKIRINNKCHCNPGDNFDWNGYSCTKRFFDMNKMPMPEGYTGQT